MFTFYLGIKGISLKLIQALEIMSVALCHYQSILFSLEEVSLVQHLVAISSEVPLLLDVDISAPLNAATKSGCFLLVSVEIDNQGKPE